MDAIEQFERLQLDELDEEISSLERRLALTRALRDARASVDPASPGRGQRRDGHANRQRGATARCADRVPRRIRC